MDKTVPPAAAHLLDFIGSIEAPKGYDTIYGNNQDKLSKPLTKMTLGEVLAAGPGWAVRFGSSACGRYQFMAGKNHTLQGLKDELGLSDSQIFDANLQDRLGYHLLRRRGYDKWINGQIPRDIFMLNLAKEWASFPVPYGCKGQKRNVTRGQSYYAGDGRNKALVSAERVEANLGMAFAARDAVPIGVAKANPSPASVGTVTNGKQTLSFWGRLMAAFAAFKNRSA